MIQKEYFTLKEAAEHCGYNPRSFARNLKDYELPKYGFSGRKYKRSDIDELMANPSKFASKQGPKRSGFNPVSL